MFKNFSYLKFFGGRCGGGLFFKKGPLHEFFFLNSIWLSLSVFCSAAPPLPTRIVSTSLAGDELLLQLLPTSEKRKRILAVSSLAEDAAFSALGADVKEIPHRAGSNVEAILSFRPDLVLAASFNKPEFLAMLQKTGLRVHILTGFHSLKDLERHVRELGGLLGETATAEHLVVDLWKGLDEMKRRLKESKIASKILLVAPDRTLIGRQTLLNDALQLVGFENLADSIGVEGWQKISEEILASLDPRWILVPGEEADRKTIREALGESFAVRRMGAWKQDRLILIPTKFFSSFSPRVVNTVETVVSHMRGVKG